MEKEIELTILMPCLNEEKTIGNCIKEARSFLEKNNINGEILIVDNGSTDDSINIAKREKAKIVYCKEKGYGIAIWTGINVANGKYVIMGDSDESYEFYNLMPFIEKLEDGYDLVIGNRYKGKIEKGAMPFLHRYVGTPLITMIGKIMYKTKVGDFNCGIRGFIKNKIINLDLKEKGMEFATEMIIKAQMRDLKLTEIPVNLRKDGRGRKSHLNTFRDGARHLKILFKSYNK